MEHEKPSVIPIKIGNISVDGQPCADPKYMIRNNPKIALRKLGVKFYPAKIEEQIIMAYWP